MPKGKGFICSRCGGKVYGKPARVGFFLEDNGEFVEDGLPEDMIRAIEERFCGSCAVWIRQAMYGRASEKLPELPALKPGYVRPVKKAPAKKRATMPKAKETSDRVFEMYRQGVQVRDIAEELGLTQMTVKRHVKELKEDGKLPRVPRKLKIAGLQQDHRKTLTEGEEKQMFDMYRSGMTYAMIGIKFGVSQQVVGYHVRRYYTKAGRQKSGS